MISYRHDAQTVKSEQLHGFFVGWPNPPSPETHLKLLNSSRHIVLAIDDQTENVVGFITAISDSVLAAYIPFLEVLPKYKGNGIGSELVRRMLKRLDGLYMIDLLCDSDVQAFYSQLDMEKATGMTKRNFDRQSGA